MRWATVSSPLSSFLPAPLLGHGPIGPQFTPKQFQNERPIPKHSGNHTFRTSKGNLVLCWGSWAFCEPQFQVQLHFTAYDFEIAVRISSLGTTYGRLWVLEHYRAFQGSGWRTKRKTVYPNDLEKYHQLWDKQLANSFPKIAEVAQPLTPYCPKKQKKSIWCFLAKTFGLNLGIVL